MLAYLSFLIARARADRGATAVEYGLMVALIAVVIIAAVILLGDNLSGIFGGVADELEAPAAP
jgi:pilus assembly protein Flp/PilA